jgi:hypothetical protein
MPRYTTTTKGIPEVTQPKRPEITYSEQKTEQSWIDQGFAVPEDLTIHNEKKRFLSEVDVRKTPLDRKPTLFIRQKVTVTDTKTKKRISKEVLIYHEIWRARNWIISL